MNVAADLHIHTTASDGLLSPVEVVRKALSLGLSAIAITDHDTIDGISSAMNASEDDLPEIVPGIELSTEIDDREIHILGYYIDHTDPDLISLLKKLQESRFSRAEKTVKKLSSLGYQINLGEVLDFAGKAAPGRLHVARALVEKGYLPSVAAAFNDLLGYRMPGYVERYKLRPAEAIAKIRAAGGLAAWAHPYLSGKDSLLTEFISHGLQGLEVYHPDQNASQTGHYRQLAKSHRLFICGGSDFHGPGVGRASFLGNYGLNVREFKDFRENRLQLL
ncbi:MAG: PHP domain-containing protein [Dethiobacter sp.]|jgi:predicted metal-dependent phosphoesterase TrpH|nr:PHP domain-containing protein [Dethiobacter sp.]MBS3989031.1 PHP domain-containing protein [Dethiobacter sp.]